VALAMTDCGSPLQFGVSVTPAATEIENIFGLVRLADDTGPDRVAIPDYTYNHIVRRLSRLRK
jgi:hypothetical protein